MQCLHSLTRRHNISVLSTIHQPNYKLFSLFDSLYVLFKGGICLYSGKPGNLRDFLNDCDIECDSNANPIEVLLKISSNDCKDKTIEKIVNKTNQQISQTIEANTSETTNYTFKGKNFIVKDILYLSMRRLRIYLVDNKKSLVIETLFHILLALLLTHAVNEDHSKLDGCFDKFYNSSTVDCMEKERQKFIIDQNIYLFYLTSFIFLLTTIAISTKNLMNEIDIFLVELKNSKF